MLENGRHIRERVLSIAYQNGDVEDTGSESESESDEDEADNGVISRRRLRADEARERFGPARVDARGVDFSDRLASERKSYRTSRRNRRTNGEVLDGSDDGSEDESLPMRINRLQREFEEVQAELREGEGQSLNGDDTEVNISRLLGALDGLQKQSFDHNVSAKDRMERQVQKYSSLPTDAGEQGSKARGLEAVTADSGLASGSNEAMMRVSEVDSRLTMIEEALGLTGTNMPETAIDNYKPVLPAIAILEEQIKTLSVSDKQVENINRRLRLLKEETDRLKLIQKTMIAMGEDAGTLSVDAITAGRPSSEATGKQRLASPDQLAKIDSLHGALGTVEALAPTLPLVLERLRSLHTVHTNAGWANDRLKAIEARQQEQDAELSQWRQSLDRLEQSVGGSEQVTIGNMKVVEGWVKDLERRFQSTSS